MSREEQFDFYWKEIFDGLPYNPIEFNVYRFDQSMSLPSKFNKLYEMFKQLALNNQEVMDYLKEFVETFDFKLETTVKDILIVWLNEGLLADVVREAINEEVVEARTDYLDHTYLDLKERLDDERKEVIDSRGESQTLGERLDSEKAEVTARLAQIVINVNDFPIQVPETDDTGRIQRALDSLKTTGGKLLFPDGSYTLNSGVSYVFENDVRIVLIGGTNSIIKIGETGDFFQFTSTGNIGDVEIYNLNFDGVNGSEYWDTDSRRHGILVKECRSVKIQNNKIKNLYGTGIMCLKNISVDISNNILLNVRGYNVINDNYGDGIYVGQNTKIISVKHNFIKNELSIEKRCGRIGITLEFDVSNAQVEGNYIFGYNRGLHIEGTMGGHNIKNNVVEGCFAPIVFIQEKGFVETTVENNTFSNKGFINAGDIELSFKGAAVIVNANAVGYTPKLKFINNFVEVRNDNNVANNSGLTYSVSIGFDNVVFENNVVTVGSTVTGNHFFAASRKNVKIKHNTLKNVGTISIGYTTDCEFSFNDVTCASIVNDRANNLRFNNNKVSPQEGLLVLGSVLSNRPQGTFNDNIIERYGAKTIDNTSQLSNDIYLEVSGNQFIRKAVDSPALPTTRTTNPEACDVFYTDVDNIIIDEVTPVNNRKLAFYGGCIKRNGKRYVRLPSQPTNKTWDVGDEVLILDPTSGGYRNLICTVAGTPGTWKGYGLIEE